MTSVQNPQAPSNGSKRTPPVRKSSKFKIQETEETRLGDTLVSEQIEYARFEKLSQRVTLITILIPILIGVMIFIGYRDIREMVSQTRDKGSKELTSMAQSLDSSISNLSVKQAKLEESLAGKLEDQAKIESSVQESLKKMEALIHDSIQKMDAEIKESQKKTEASLAELLAGKADKKETAEAIAGWTVKQEGLQKDLKAGLDKMGADIKSFEKKVTDELAKTAETVGMVTTRLAECQSDIVLLTSDKADKRAVDQSLKNQERLQEQTKNLLQSIQTKMAELEKLKSEAEKSPGPAAGKKISNASSNSKTGEAKDSKKNGTPPITEEKLP